MRTRRIDTEDNCHCGASYQESDHCPECGCEQYESGDCGHVSEEYAEEPSYEPCPICDGDCTLLGRLSLRQWQRCRDCGCVYSHHPEFGLRIELVTPNYEEPHGTVRI